MRSKNKKRLIDRFKFARKPKLHIKPKRSRRNLVKKISLTALVCAMVFLTVILYSFVKRKFLYVSSYSCSVGFETCPKRIESKLNEINFTLTDYYSAKLKIFHLLNNQKEIVNVYTSYNLSSKEIKLELVLRPAVYLVKSLNDQKIYSISKEGYVLYQGNDDVSLPYLELKQFNDPVNKKVDTEILSFLESIRLVNFEYQVNSAKLYPGYTEVLLNNGISVLFNTDKDSKYIAGAVKIILDNKDRNVQQLKGQIDSNHFTIDLRYKNVVLR